MPLPKLLICDDDQTFQLAIKHVLKSKYECKTAFNSEEAIAIIKKQPLDLILLDIQLRTPNEGLELIPKLKQIDDRLTIVMSSGRTDFQTVREAMRLGAVDYLPKDFEPEELLITLTRALEKRQLIEHVQQQNFEVVSEQKKKILIGKSAQIKTLQKTLDRIRDSEATVIITGETGTGKEVVARNLRKTRADGTLAPFVAVDSATIKSSMAESQLFGHEKGAFTGAEKTVKGFFEEANGGIIYFDELGNMPLEIQSKLLRVLQEREITRLGSSRSLALQFRVVCATNKNLEEMTKAGTFKEDLYQRLNVIPIQLPPLRERSEDIRLLIDYFVSQLPGPKSLVFTENALDALSKYRWPGNIRELSNLVSYLSIITEGDEIDLSDLPPHFRENPKTTQNGGESETFYDRVAQFEKKLLNEAYAVSGGNISKLAMTLGMDRSHLYTKLKEYEIHSTKKA